MNGIVIRRITGIILIMMWPFAWATAQGTYEKTLQPVVRGQLVSHTYYALDYCEEHEQAWWVFYRLTSESINGAAKRKDDFRADPMVTSGSASLADYKGSGYDRGHLCPAADMKLNDLSMSETFFLSNMSPQTPAFNQGIWNNLEDLVRNFCLANDSLYIVTGPVFKNNIGSIGSDSVTIPGYYYKVLYNPSGTQRMLAFVLPNEKRSDDFSVFTLTVDSLEQLTGIDFFPGLPDDLENRLEAVCDFSAWNVKSARHEYVTDRQLRLYPNPAGNFIGLKGLSGQARLQISDMTGRPVIRQNITENQIISIAHLPAGTYLVQIRYPNGQETGLRFVRR